MPAIKDFASSRTTSAGVSHSVVLPNIVSGELLVLFLQSDAGTGLWTLPTNWTELVSTATGTSRMICYKISDGTEVNFTATHATSDTMNSTCFSISDFNATNPFGATPNVVTGSVTPTQGTSAFAGTITTTVDDCLVLMAGFTVNAGASSFHGPTVNPLTAVVGTAEGSLFGYMFKKYAGATPTAGNVFGTTASSPSTCYWYLIQVSPPSTGDIKTVPYVASEDSRFIHAAPFSATGSPIGYTNTSPEATMGTLAVQASTGGTTAGMLPYINATTIQTPAAVVANTVQGADLTSTANIDFSDGSGLLTHVSATRRFHEMQDTLGGIGGFFVGMSDASGNKKCWTSNAKDVVGLSEINDYPHLAVPSATAQFSSGTLSAATIRKIHYYARGSSAQVILGIIWKMKESYVCGGSSVFPGSFEEMIDAISSRKKRRSALFQGSNQALVFQPIVIGNGSDLTNMDFRFSSIEFPSTYDRTKKKTQVHAPADWLGLKYYLGASDVVNHSNSVISSASRFHWGLHASSSTSATYNFERLSVIGAGTITLNKALTFNRLVINDYTSLNITDATLTNGTIAGVPASNDSVTLNGNTTFTGQTIDVSGVTAGNRWLSTATPNKFTSCNFTGGGGHAIRITTAGTYTFSGNQITGFGANGTDGAFFLNDSGGAVTINVAGGGSTPTYKNVGASTTTIVSGATLTLTGLQTGSDIVILEAGTSTEKVNIDSNSGSTYAFSYTSNDTIDICVYKIGYEPFTIRGYVLSGTDGSVPIAQRPDRAYNNPT